MKGTPSRLDIKFAQHVALKIWLLGTEGRLLCMIQNSIRTMGRNANQKKRRLEPERLYPLVQMEAEKCIAIKKNL